MSYEQDVKIDEYELVKELTKQPSLIYKYSKEAAIATAKFLHAKESMTLRKAEAKKVLDKSQAQVELRIRSSDPTSHGLEKFTEATINAIIKQDQEYNKALEDYNEEIQGWVNELADLSEQADILQGAVQGIIHKRASLENLVKLFLAGYYGDPSIDNEGITRATQEQVRNEQAEGLRGRRKLRERR